MKQWYTLLGGLAFLAAVYCGLYIVTSAFVQTRDGPIQWEKGLDSFKEEYLP